MAINMKVEGLLGLSEQLAQLGENAQSVASSALYEGAGIMATEIQDGAEGIKTAPFHFAVFGAREPSPEEKEAILGAVGIAKFEKNGAEVNTSVGYGNTGYAMVAGKRKAIAQIANAINSGTSFMNKQPFVRKAATSGGKKAGEAITKSIEDKFNAIMKN